MRQTINLALSWVVLSSLIIWLAGCVSASPPPRAPTQDKEKIANVNTLLGIQHMLDGNNELALRKLEKAVQAKPNYAEAHMRGASNSNQISEPLSMTR